MINVVLATELGVWTTDNIDGLSTNWAVTNNGLANVRCDMIKYRISDKKMIVATHGRGLYTGVVSGGPCQTDLTITDNPANGVYQASNSIITNGPVQVTTNGLFRAGTDLLMAPNFEVTNGAVFETVIGPCQ